MGFGGRQAEEPLDLVRTQWVMEEVEVQQGAHHSLLRTGELLRFEAGGAAHSVRWNGPFAGVVGIDGAGR